MSKIESKELSDLLDQWQTADHNDTIQHFINDLRRFIQSAEAKADAGADKYAAFRVEGECEMGICEGWRSFVATCGDPYYRGRSYEDARKTYEQQVQYTDGIHYAVIFTGYNPETDDWEVIEDNEINDASIKK